MQFNLYQPYQPSLKKGRPLKVLFQKWNNAFFVSFKFLSKHDVLVVLLVAADAHPCAPWWLHGRQKACAKVIYGLLNTRRTYPSCKPYTLQISRVRKNQQLWLAGNIYRHRLYYTFIFTN